MTEPDDTPLAPPTVPDPDDACPHCGKQPPLCVCEQVQSLDHRVRVLILQHPQEQDKELGTARLTVRHLRNAMLRVGLSWPSLAKALDRDVDPKRWAILHLGSLSSETMPAGRDLVALDGKGKPLPDQDHALAIIQGIVVLDGTWSQAKTLWWRNAWVLKGPRLAILPKQSSLYGKLRREPRREGLSTLEATAFVLSRLEKRPDIETAMLSTFRRLLQRYRDMRAAAKPARTRR